MVIGKTRKSDNAIGSRENSMQSISLLSLDQWKGSEEHESAVIDDVTQQDISPAKHL